MDTIKALDGLETTFHLASISKRYHLFSLSAALGRLQDSFSRRPKRANTGLTRKSDSDAVFGRADSQALASMMAKAYPDLKPTRIKDTKGKDEYGKKIGMLRQQLLAGQRWST
jgi:hypothetical protein